MRTLHVLIALLASAVIVGGSVSAASWPQWGGPTRDFEAPDPGLVEDWTEGIPELWSRPLGEGYSGIASDGKRLYTQYGLGEREVVAALDAATGEEVWSHEHDPRKPDGMRLNYGPGPHATPLVAGGRVFAVGTAGLLMAIDAETGELVWQQSLWQEHGGFQLKRGYGASPIAWRGTVIVPVGGEAPGMISFDQADGSVVWQSVPFDSAQSSPVLLEVEGTTQLLQFIQDEIVALDPDDGALLWRQAHKAFGPYNIATPVLSDGTVFISSSYGGGSRLLRPFLRDGEAGVEEVWKSKRLGVHFTNALRIGDRYLGSNGRNGVHGVALDAETGELVWKSRAVARANFVRLGERFLALEADGRLILGAVGSTGPEILAETQLLETQSWTAPALVGNRLYVRDRARISAFELPIQD